jgi:hypothetical protein
MVAGTASGGVRGTRYGRRHSAALPVAATTGPASRVSRPPALRADSPFVRP